MVLLLQNSQGKERIIAEPINKREVIEEINKFLDEHNYKSYYFNICEYEENKLRIDFGSWSQFFLIDGMSIKEWVSSSEESE